MVKFTTKYEYNIRRVSAIYDGTLIATFKISPSAIDDGVIEVLTGEIPLVVALWVTNCGITNHGWFEISNGYLYNVEVDRYTSQERRWRIAKVRV